MNTTLLPLSNVSDLSGPLNQVFQAIYACKSASTCPALKTRQFFFEPNQATISEWLRLGIYSMGIDTRVVFVCESPGPSVTPQDFPNIERCWCITSKDKRFSEVRKKYGLENCYITNTVKCGVRRQGSSSHSNSEIGACIPFLLKELEIIKPQIIVAVGGKSYSTINRHILPRLSRTTKIKRITHYSARRNTWDYWNKEFSDLLDLIE